MCGFFCYIGDKQVSIKNAIDSIDHRGPDSEGYLTYNNTTSSLSNECEASLSPGMKIAMGFKRLAIIDLLPQSNQPFSDETGNFHIVFNGAIYNYLELRSQLIIKGYQFRTNSDTEVLLKAYMHWGAKCLERFNGMWAFIILDLTRKQVFISRDRFGVKPLYFSEANNEICFFSEIKQVFKTGVTKELNINVVRDFLESSILDAGNETFFKHIFKFPAAHYAIFQLESRNHSIVPLPYYKLQENKAYNNISYEDAKIEFLNLFQSSIELRFRSDVPVGTCLSGGLDSSSIVSLIGTLGKKINAFTIDNKIPSLSEISYAESVVNKYDCLSSVVTYNEDDDINLLDKILDIQDEPISGMGVISQWKVMELAKNNGVTVLLDGQGGDEILGGYKKFIYFYLKELLNSGRIGPALKEGKAFLAQDDFKIFEKEGVRRYLNRTGIIRFLSEELLSYPRLYNIGLSGANDFQQKSYEDIFYYSFPQLLRYEDRNSMAFSIESRVPFLDFRLVEFIYSIPTGYKIRNGYTKAILRDSLTGILPDQVRLRKSKLGFSNPEEVNLNGVHSEYFRKYFKSMKNPFLLNGKVADDFESKRPRIDPKSMIRIYLFDRWYQRNFSS